MTPEEIQASAVLYTSDRDITLDKAEGEYIWDVNGKKYLDFAGAIAVNALGNVNPEILEAVKGQMDKLGQTSMSHNTKILEDTSRKLIDQFDSEGKVFWVNSGAEANEAAMKAICFYQHAKGRKERQTIITFDGSFHGRTWRTLAATGKYMEGMGPTPCPVNCGFKRLPYNDVEAVKAAIDDSVAGILVEPLQGEGGILVPSQEFLETLRALADEHDLVLAFDEVQCGMGRLGTLFAYQTSGVKPDVITLAKALSGGAIPVSACLMSKRVTDALTDEGKTKFSNGTTYGGNPLALTAAGKTLEIMLRDGNEFMGAESTENAKYLKDQLETLIGDVAEEVRGVGFMLGIKLKEDHSNFAIVNQLRENGLFTMPAGDNVVRFVPPLNTKKNHIDEAIKILERTLNAN